MAKDQRALDLLGNAMQINVVPCRCDTREDARLLAQLRIRHGVVPAYSEAIAVDRPGAVDAQARIKRLIDNAVRRACQQVRQLDGLTALEYWSARGHTQQAAHQVEQDACTLELLSLA